MLRTPLVHLDIELLREYIIKLVRLNIYISDKNLTSRVHTAARRFYKHVLILNLDHQIRLCKGRPIYSRPGISFHLKTLQNMTNGVGFEGRLLTCIQISLVWKHKALKMYKFNSLKPPLHSITLQ